MRKKRNENPAQKAASVQQNNRDVRSIRIRLIITNVIMIIIAVMLVSVITIYETGQVMKKKTGSLLATLNTQMKVSVDNYMDTLVDSGTLVFSEELNYRFDATKETDRNKKVRLLKRIKDNLAEVSLLNSYIDFGIVYRTGLTTGKISKTTKKLIGDGAFEEFEAAVDKNKRNEGWKAGMGGDYRRIYHLKRLNENAILIISFYSTELEKVFEHAEDNEQITLRLLDEEQNIIYSSDYSEIGAMIPEKMADVIKQGGSAAIEDENNMYNVLPFGTEWSIVCSVKMDTVLKEQRDVMIRMMFMGAAIALAGCIVCLLVSRSITNPLSYMMKGLNEKAEYDLLTGVLNKISFEQYAQAALENIEPGTEAAYILTDVDDFKKINDICGHAAGDRVLKQYGEILEKVFYADIVGRIGGDEFSALLKVPQGENRFKYIGERIKNIQRSVALIAKENADIHVSIGIAFSGESGYMLSELYRNADKALYATKRRGKNGYTIFTCDQTEREGDIS